MLSNFKISKNNIAEYSFIGFIATLPFEDIYGSIMLVIMISLAIIFKSKKEFLQTLGDNKAIWFLLIYFSIAVISLSYSQDFPESFKKISKILAFVLIPLAFVLIKPSEQLLNLAKKAFVYGMMAFCIFSLLKLGYNYIVNFDISHWYNFVQDSMYHKYMPEDAMYLNTGLVFLLFGNYSKNFKLFVAILFLAVIVLFAVRLGLFVYLLIMAVYFVSNIKSLLNFKSAAVLIGIVIFAGVLINQSRYANDKFYDTLQKIGFNTGDQVSEIGAKYHKIGLREKIWSASVELIKQRPIFGYGAGVEKKPIAIINDRKGYDIPQNYNSHNQFLSGMVQYGIVGMIWLLGTFVLLFTVAARMKSMAWILILGVMIISMTTESYLELQQGVFYFCVFTSLLIWKSIKNPDQLKSL